MNEKNEFLHFDLEGIKKSQRNRYPLLFVDKITEVIPGKSAKSLKCFTYNEWFFLPIMMMTLMCQASFK